MPHALRLNLPLLQKKWAHGDVGPTPMFGYQGSIRHYDLPMPDYGLWGHEYQYLQARPMLCCVHTG